MTNEPLIFNSSAKASGDFEKTWLIKSGNMETLCSIPEEFKGHGGGFSPEDLFLQALINCFIGTFKVYARASKIIFSNLQVNGSLAVGKDNNSKVRMRSCHLSIHFESSDKAERLATLVSKVMRDGFILNSVKTEMSYDLFINGLQIEI